MPSPLPLRESGTCYHRQSRHCRHCRLSTLYWRRNCFADRTTTHTSGNSSIDTSLISDIHCGPEVLFETCVAMKFVNDDDDDRRWYIQQTCFVSRHRICSTSYSLTASKDCLLFERFINLHLQYITLHPSLFHSLTSGSKVTFTIYPSAINCWYLNSLQLFSFICSSSSFAWETSSVKVRI